MPTTLTISKRFRGPPGSVNGGYACGVTASAFGEEPAEVVLRLPPPLESEMRLERSGEQAALMAGDAVVAQARPSAVDVEVPEAVSFDRAEASARAFDVEAYRAAHVFPGCFVCGPDRAQGDGMRIFPAPIEAEVPLVAWPWVPDASLVGGDDRVEPTTLWAALDCPSGLVWMAGMAEPEPAVLGKLAVRIDRRPSRGERLVVAGWQIGREGRRQLSGSVIWSSEGEVLARAAATWVTLTAEQARAFGIPQRTK